MAEKEIMTAAELAEYLSFSKNWVYRKAEEGEIPGMRMGNRWRFKRSLINEWIEGRAPGEGRRPRGRASRLEGRLAEGLGFIRSKREITTKDYAKKFNVCEATARKDLKELIRQNLVRKIGGGPNIRYVAK